jgi:hypothetical protein
VVLVAVEEAQQQIAAVVAAETKQTSGVELAVRELSSLDIQIALRT